MSNKCALSGWDANQGLRFDLFVLVSWQLYSLSQIYSIYIFWVRASVFLCHIESFMKLFHQHTKHPCAWGKKVQIHRAPRITAVARLAGLHWPSSA